MDELDSPAALQALHVTIIITKQTKIMSWIKTPTTY